MSPRIYVEGLTSSTTDTRMSLLCASYRSVTSACVIKSKIIGQPFGYGRWNCRRMAGNLQQKAVFLRSTGSTVPLVVISSC